MSSKETFRTVEKSVNHSEPARRDIIEFSKKQSSVDRKVVSDRIRRSRSEYFEKKGKYKDAINSLKKRITEHQSDILELMKEVVDLKESIATKQATLFSSLSNILEIRALRQDLGAKKSILKEREKEHKLAIALLDNYEYLLQNLTNLKDAKKLLIQFYAEQEDLMQQIEEEKAGSVAEVIRQHQVLFIHGTDDLWREDNSNLNRRISTKDKMKIVLGFEPTVCASTIGKGDTSRNAWEPVGVLLSGGEIKAAAGRDAGSRAKNRDIVHRRVKAADIKRAIHERYGSYNEFSVANPTVAGIYVFADALDVYDQSRRTVWSADADRLGRELHLPVYIIDNGDIFRARVEKVKNNMTGEWEINIVKDYQVSLDDISKLKCPIPEFMKKQMREEILTDSPLESHRGKKAA